MTRPDIIVIGGGIAGVSATAMLARDARVILVEAEPQLGYHATGRSAAIFIRNYGNDVLRALNALSAPTLQEPNGISDRSLLSPRGELLIADESETAALEEYAKGATGLERLTAAQAVALVPILRPERIAAAVIEPDAQDIDVDRMLQGYARLLRERGGGNRHRGRHNGVNPLGKLLAGLDRDGHMVRAGCRECGWGVGRHGCADGRHCANWRDPNAPLCCFA